MWARVFVILAPLMLSANGKTTLTTEPSPWFSTRPWWLNPTITTSSYSPLASSFSKQPPITTEAVEEAAIFDQTTSDSWSTTTSSPATKGKRVTPSAKPNAKSIPEPSPKKEIFKTCPRQLGSREDFPCWIMGKGSPTCYCFSLHTSDWNGARRKCNHYGFDLISMETSTEHQSVFKQIREIVPELKGYAYWTSGRFNETSARWVWTTTRRDKCPSSRHTEQIVETNVESHITYVDDYGSIGGVQPYRSVQDNFKDTCLLSDVTSDRFITRYCSSHGYRFICERSIGLKRA